MRKEVIGNATLYLGDCLEALAELNGLRDGCQNVDVSVEQGRGAGNDLKTRIDAVITDPPYGVGFKYANHDDRPEAYEGGYGTWLWERLEKAEALLPPGAPVFVWQAAPNIKHFAAWFPRQWRVMVGAKNFVQMRPTAMQWSYDPIVVWWTPGDVKPYSMGTASKDFHIANTAPVVSDPSNLEKAHPCPRPLDQVRHIVGQWCAPGSVVLDLFMGSGTTGVACMEAGMSFIGIEKDPAYFDIACKRIYNAQRQRRMFA